jgi:7-cyano-7-deazaguanine synthase in queuosine biosynthesis
LRSEKRGLSLVLVYVQNALMTTLVMFSGGLDSTAMLVKLLAEERDELHVHHSRMINREGRDRAEQRAVEAIVAWCRSRYRPFRYSESALNFSALEAIPIDYIAIAYVACQVAIDTPGCNRIAVGALSTDTDIVNRTARQKRVFEEMYAGYRARKLGEPRVEWILPVYDTPKAELARRLPPQLLDLTWSCRTPVQGFRPCGACKACKVREGLRLAGATADNSAT